METPATPTFTNNFARNLRIVQAASGLTPEEFAKEVGIGPRVLYNYCAGKASPPLDFVILVSEKFQTTIDVMVYKQVKISITAD